LRVGVLLRRHGARGSGSGSGDGTRLDNAIGAGLGGGGGRDIGCVLRRSRGRRALTDVGAASIVVEVIWFDAKGELFTR
jgi:hypothetical protein